MKFCVNFLFLLASAAKGDAVHTRNVEPSKVHQPPSASPTDEKAATVRAVFFFSRVGVIFTGLENATAAEAALARQAHQSRYFRSKKGDSQRNVVWGPTL